MPRAMSALFALLLFAAITQLAQLGVAQQPPVMISAATTPAAESGPPAPMNPRGEPLLYETGSADVRVGGVNWWSVAVSPDGKTVASAQGDGNSKGEVKLWDRAAGKVRKVIAEPKGTRCVAISPNGKLLATGNYDAGLRLYDPETGTLRAIGDEGSGGHKVAINGVCFFKNGVHVATAGLDNTVRVWDVSAAKLGKGEPAKLSPVAIFEGHTQGVLSVAVSADGKTLLSGSFDRTARTWDVPNPLPKAGEMPTVVKKERLSMQGHGNPIEAVAISPDGELLVTGSWDAQLLVRDKEGKKIEFQSRFNVGVMCAAFSPDGKFLAAGSGNMNASGNPGEVRVWDVAAKKQVAYRPEYPAAVLGVAFTPDSKTVATVGQDRALHLWEYADPKAVKTHSPDGLAFAQQPLLAAAVSPNGDLLAVANEAKTVYVLNRRDSALLAALGSHDDVVAGLAFSPDGKTLATASYDKTVKLWDTATWKERKTLTGHTGWVLGVAFSPDGKTLATGSYDKTVRMWDAATGESKATWREHTAGVRSLSFDKDGKRLVSGGSDRIVRVWDAADGNVLQQLKGHKGAVRSVAFSPDGASIATGSEDKTVKLWTAADGKEVRTFPTLPDMVTTVRFSPKGQTLAAALFTGGVAILDPLTGRQRQVLSGHNDAVTGAIFADDGKSLLTVSQDRTMKQWSALKASAVAPQGSLAMPKLVAAAAFLPNGRTAVLGGYDGSLVLWDVAGGKATPVPSVPKLGPVAQLAASAGFVAVVPQEGDAHVLPLGTNGKAWSVPGKFAVFTPDGKQVALAHGKDAILYDAASGKELRRFVNGHDGPVIRLAFSPDGKRLATAGDDTKVRLWETETATKRQETPAFGNYSAITQMAFSPDGTRLAVAAYGPDQPPPDCMTGNFRPIKQVSVFTVPASESNFANPQIFAPQPTNEPIAALAWSTGQQIVTPSSDGTIRITEAVPGVNPRETKRFRGHDSAVLAFALAPDGLSYITAGEDMSVRRWELSPPGGAAAAVRMIGPFDGSKVWVGQPDPAGKYLYASASADKKLQIFSRIPAPSAIELKGNIKGAYSAAFAPDGKTLLTGHVKGELIVWDAKTGKELARPKGDLKQAVRGIAFTKDGKSFVTVGGHGGNNNEPGDAVIWDAAKYTPKHRLEGHKTPLWCVTRTPDDTLFVAGCFDGSIVMWDTATGKHVRTLEKHTAGARSVAFSPDGKTMVSGGFDNVLRVWDTETWEETHTFPLPNSRPSTVLFSPDGKEVVCGSRPNVGSPGDMTDCIIYAFRLDDPAGKPRELKGHAGAVLGLAFLKDGTLVSAGGRDREYGELKAWDFARGEVIGDYRGHRLWLEWVAPSPDGETLVSCGWGGGNDPGEVRVWNAGSFKPAAAVATLPTPYISCGETTPDGKTLVLGGWDGSVVAFDMTNPAKPVKGKTAKGHAGGIRSVAFDAAGKRFVTAAEDGTVVLWDAVTLEKLNEWQASKLPVYRARFTPDGTKVVTAAGQWRTQAEPGELRVWHPRTGEEAGRFPDQSRAVWDFVFLDGGKTLVSAQALGGSPGDATLKVWDFDTKTEKRAVKSLSGVRCLAASPDGKFVAMANNAGAMRVLDTATWQEAFTPPEHTKVVFHLAFGPDNRTLYSASEDGTVGITRLPGGAPGPAATTPPAATPAMPKE